MAETSSDMIQKERITQIKTALTRLAREGDSEASFIMLEAPKTGKYIICALMNPEGASSRRITVMIPLDGFSEEEKKKIGTIVEEAKGYDSGGWDIRVPRKMRETTKEGHLDDYSIDFTIRDIGEAANFVDTIFINAFKLEKTYTLSIDQTISKL